MRKNRGWIWVALAMTLLPTLSFADIYSYVDRDGVAHFTNKPGGDPRENILGGVRYLRVLANMFNGDLELTLAGYNAGENAVVRHGGIPPFDETEDYVARVLAYYRRYRETRDPVSASVSTMD